MLQLRLPESLFFSAIELKDSSLVVKDKEREQQGVLSEDETVQVLKTLSKDLQAIHRQVVQHLKGGSGSEEWIQIGLIIDRLLFIFYIFFSSVSFITIIIIWVNSYKTR